MKNLFTDQQAAQRMRDVVRKIVAKRINELRPAYRYGVVQSVNVSAGTASVLPNGQTDPATYRMAVHCSVGQSVRIDGLPGDRFVAGVQPGPAGLLPGATFTGEVDTQSVSANLTGTQGRFVGVLATAGSPTSGTYAVGDVTVDSVGRTWRCSVAGTPGTWLTTPAITGTSSSRFASPQVGTQEFDTDTGRMVVYNGTSWLPVSEFDNIGLGAMANGTAPAVGSRLLMEAGTDVLTTTGSGTYSLTFPTAFPNGVVVVLAVMHNGAVGSGVNTGTTSKTGFSGTVWVSSGGAISAYTGTFGISWMAVGF